MQVYQHRTISHLDDNGFGIKLEKKTSAYLPPHWHQALEILLFIKGTVACKFAHSTLRAKPGDLYIINSHDVHETRCSRDAVYLCVHILPSAMLRYVPDFDQRSFSLNFDPADTEKSEAFEQLKVLMEKILREVREHDEDHKLECQASLFGIAAILVKNFSQTLAVEETNLRRTDMTRLEPVLERIHLHHAEELSLDEAVELMGLNKEYFCRLFKKNMGVSYLQYINQVRATAVYRDLETSDDPIGEIGERHGFKDPKLMNRYFRELYDCTPSEKRKALREIQLEER